MEEPREPDDALEPESILDSDARFEPPTRLDSEIRPDEEFSTLGDDSQFMADEAERNLRDPSWKGFKSVAVRGQGEEWIVSDGETAYRIDKENNTVVRVAKTWYEGGGWRPTSEAFPAGLIAAGVPRPDAEEPREGGQGNAERKRPEAKPRPRDPDRVPNWARPTDLSAPVSSDHPVARAAQKRFKRLLKRDR